MATLGCKDGASASLMLMERRQVQFMVHGVEAVTCSPVTQSSTWQCHTNGICTYLKHRLAQQSHAMLSCDDCGEVLHAIAEARMSKEGCCCCMLHDALQLIA